MNSQGRHPDQSLRETFEELVVSECENDCSWRIFHLGAGVKVQVEHQTIRIELLYGESKPHDHATTEQLIRLFEMTPADYRWVVDLSAYDKLPLLILGTLLNCGDKFVKAGRKAKLINVAPTFFQSRGMERLSQYFNVFLSSAKP